MEFDKEQYAREAAYRQAYFLGKHESSQRRSTNIDPRRVRLDSSNSSSNPKHTSDKSCKDGDSSDSRKCVSSHLPIYDLKIWKVTDEDNSNDHWKKGERRERPIKNEHGIEIENYETTTKLSDKFLIQQKDYSDLKSHSNQGLKSNSNEKELCRGLFFKSSDSISDIEPLMDSHTKYGSVLTSTPNSDVADELFLDAGKYVPQGESAMESTLLDEIVVQTTIHTNRRYYEIYHHPQLAKNYPKDHSEIFGNNYIPPPVPPSTHTFLFPPIHRLPSPISSPYQSSVPRRPVLSKLSIPRSIFPQYVPQLVTQPRHLIPPPNPDFRHLPDRSSYIHCHLSPPCLQPESDHLPLDPPRIPFAILPPHLPQGRIVSPHSPQDMFNPSNLQSHKEDDPFYIPPPVPPPWSSDPDFISAYSLMNRVIFDP